MPGPASFTQHDKNAIVQTFSAPYSKVQTFRRSGGQFRVEWAPVHFFLYVAGIFGFQIGSPHQAPMAWIADLAGSINSLRPPMY